MLGIYSNNKYIEEHIAQELNAIHKNIEFTYKVETNNSIVMGVWLYPTNSLYLILLEYGNFAVNGN